MAVATETTYLKERLCGRYDRDEVANVCRRWIGLPEIESDGYVPKSETRWNEKTARRAP